MSAGNRDNNVDSNPDCTHPEMKANDSAATYEEDRARVGTVVDTRGHAAAAAGTSEDEALRVGTKVDTRGQAARAAGAASEDEALRVGTKVDTRLGTGAGGNQTISSGEMRDGT